MSTTQQRLKKIEAAIGASEEQLPGLEFYDISAEGELVRRTEPYLMAYAHRKANRIIQVVLVDSGEDGGPGPRFLAWKRRRKLAAIEWAT